MMLKREVAKRVFAKEFEAARNLEAPGRGVAPEPLPGGALRAEDRMGEKDSKTPNFLLSPLGLLINRVFVVGVLTEIDNVGEQNDMWKARVVDPTGAFTVYAGQFQPEASIFFSTVEVPAFVALSGKARVFEPEAGSVFVSVRAEEVNVVDEELRNRWVVDTAEQTVERLEAFSKALSSGFSGFELSEYLVKTGVPAELAEGISLALEQEGGRHHGEFLRQLGGALKEGLRALNLDSKDAEGAEADIKEFALELMREMGKGKGVDYGIFLKEAAFRGVPEETVEEAVRSLLAEGQCYEPRIGVIRPVS
ncbi:MAG: DNA-binding protein [Methanosarcinaceae archaeon]|nr:DNA-binding protein [Methanosarcinaceae archaeon]